MTNKKIVLILFLLVLLPALFYTVYEISIYNENENALTQIYDQKLSSILFSINQYYWDTSQRVKSDFVHELMNSSGPLSKRLDSSIQKISGLNAVFITDSLISDFRASINPDSALIFTSAQLQDSITNKSNVVKRLFHRRKIGYSKIEPILFHLGEGINF